MNSNSIPRETTEIPFGANVRPRSENHKQVFFLSNFDISDEIEEEGHIIVSISEIKDVLLRFVQVPSNVSIQ